MPLSIIWATTNRHEDKLLGNNLGYDRTVNLRVGNGTEINSSFSYWKFWHQSGQVLWSLNPLSFATMPKMTICATDLTSNIWMASMSKYWVRTLLAVNTKPEKVANATPQCHDHPSNLLSNITPWLARAKYEINISGRVEFTSNALRRQRSFFSLDGGEGVRCQSTNSVKGTYSVTLLDVG